MQARSRWLCHVNNATMCQRRHKRGEEIGDVRSWRGGGVRGVDVVEKAFVPRETRSETPITEPRRLRSQPPSSLCSLPCGEHKDGAAYRGAMSPRTPAHWYDTADGQVGIVCARRPGSARRQQMRAGGGKAERAQGRQWERSQTRRSDLTPP